MRLYNNEEEERTTRHETSEISKAKLFREREKKKISRRCSQTILARSRDGPYTYPHWPQQQRSPIFPSILLR